MIKKLLFTLSVMFGFDAAYSQDVSVKDGKILYNDSVILKYEKHDAIEFSIFTLKDDEIIYSKWHNNETPRYSDDDYVILNFLGEKRKVESTKDEMVISGVGLNYRKNLIKLINWLMKEKVLRTDGSIDKDKLEIFYEKYNENITARTIR